MTRVMREFDRPEISFTQQPWGLQLTALRPLNEALTHVRVTNDVFPQTFVIPLSETMTITQMHVPVDDTRNYWYAFFTSFEAPVDKATMRQQRLKAVTLPDWPYGSMMPVLFAEGAASFEELALNNQLGTLKAQVRDAWPNMFRMSRFLSAVDFVQADRLRRKVALEMARIFKEVDVLLVPSLRDEQLTITNFTGHPSLTLRAGFVHVSEARSDWAPDPAHPLPTFTPPRRVPHGITLVGRLFDDGLIGQVGMALERAFGVAEERPAGF